MGLQSLNGLGFLTLLGVDPQPERAASNLTRLVEWDTSGESFNEERATSLLTVELSARSSRTKSMSNRWDTCTTSRLHSLWWSHCGRLASRSPSAHELSSTSGPARRLHSRSSQRPDRELEPVLKRSAISKRTLNPLRVGTQLSSS